MNTTHTGQVPGFAFTERELGLWGKTWTFHTGADKASELLDLVARQPFTACDTETAGISIEDRYRLKVVTFAVGNTGWALNPRVPAEAELIRRVFDTANHVLFHNAGYDVPILVHTGLADLSLTDKVLDTLVMARAAQPGLQTKTGAEERHTLTAVAEKYLKITLDDKMDPARLAVLGYANVSDYYRNTDVDNPTYLTDAIVDAVLTLEIAPRIMSHHQDFIVWGNEHYDLGDSASDRDRAAQIMMDLLRVHQIFLRNTVVGIAVDHDYGNDYLDGPSQRIMAEKAAILSEAGVKVFRDRDQTRVSGNLNAQIVARLDEAGKLPDSWPRTATGKLSATKGLLEDNAHLDPLLQVAVDLNAEVKMRGYVQEILDAAKANPFTGRLHAGLNVYGAKSGRMSMSDPPLQQFPGLPRGTLVPDEGRTLTSLDWKAQEAYLALALAGDTSLCLEYEAGQDLYRPVQDMAGITRDQAKVALLASLYGQGARTLGARLGAGEDEGRRVRDAMDRNMPHIPPHRKKIMDDANRTGIVPTVAGRFIYVPRDIRANGQGSGEVMGYKAVNYQTQGTGADLLHHTVLELDKAGLADSLFLPIHDELVVDSESADEIADIMGRPMPLLNSWAGRTCHIRVDRTELGPRWAKG